MPLARYMGPDFHLVERRMATPKHIQKVTHWYREAQLAISQLPDIYGPSAKEWSLAVEPVVTRERIRYDIIGPGGRKGFLVIVRTSNDFARRDF